MMTKLPQDPWDFTVDQVVVVLGLGEHQTTLFRVNKVTGEALMKEGNDKTLKEELRITALEDHSFSGG